ncbi:uncharacterized protein LOC143282765 isoform X2 [Babylonia areolata]|uniref:uncharacterized protein LOC143282765 isoform X2 n=1 Tax=Babylonia areolata TaxID=304850 RepID=UPI003FD39692
MSKMPNRPPSKMDIKGSGDFKRDSSSNKNDKSHHGRSDSSTRNKHDRDHHKHDGNDDPPHSTEQKTTEEKKFTGRCRLFVGNLTSDITEDDFKKLFSAYGEVSEVYVNAGRGFGFIRMDYRQNAEAAKAALDGLQRKGRVLRVRFATHAAALKVKNLHPFVSNELLEQAFTQFGELERAIVIVDERGKSTGEGLVEFTRKPGAQQALRRISEGVFLFGADPKPIEVEPLEHKDEEDGLPEKFLTKNEQYKKEREKDPHFAPKGSFEFEFGMRWKQLAEMEKKRIENVKMEMEEARLKLEDEMQNALYDFQAEQIRQDLVRQQEELRRLEELRNQDRMRRQQELEMRSGFRSMSRRAEEERERQHEERRRQEMMMRQQEMQRRSGGGSMDGGMPRSREEMMAMRGEGGFPSGMGDQSMHGGRGGAPPMQPPPAPPSGMGLERGGPQGMSMERGGPDRAGGPQGMGMERGGPQGMGMERGRQGMGMERGGPQGMGMDRGGQMGMGMDRGGQSGMPMDRGGQQAMSRMQQGGGGQGVQGGGGANASGSGNQNVNIGGQGGGQMETDSVDQYDTEPAETSSVPTETWKEAASNIQCSQSSSTPSQFEDADDEWNNTEYTVSDGGQWRPPPEDGNKDKDVADEEKYSASDGGQQYESGNWTWEGTTGEETWKVEEGWKETDAFTDPSNFSDAVTDSENLNQDSHPVSVDGESLERSDVNDRLNANENADGMIVGEDGDVVSSYNADSASDGHWMDVQDGSYEQYSNDDQNYEGDLSWDTQELVLDPSVGESHNIEDNTVHEENSENNPSDGQNVTDNDSSYPEPDDSMALVPYVPPSDSRSSSPISSTSTSPRPPPNHAHGPNIATAATGIPLHQNPLGMGQTRFVRIHPMHIAAAVAAQQTQAAAVAAQQTQAAAMMHQQTRMAAAAAMHHQAAVRHQAAAAAVRHQATAAAAVRHQATAAMAAAAQQRTRAALLHQQIVRSRYMGAPVLVRQPFVPVPRVAAPMRVRMRLRRSVMLTEEINLHQP